MLKIDSLVNQMKVVLIIRTNSSNIRCTESLPRRGRGTALAVDEESIVRNMFAQTSEQANQIRLRQEETDN